LSATTLTFSLCNPHILSAISGRARPFICCLRRQYLRLFNVEDRMVKDGDEDFGRKPSWAKGRKTSEFD
jgi:hypothetical protein